MKSVVMMPGYVALELPAANTQKVLKGGVFIPEDNSSCLQVFAVASDVEGVKAGDKVYCSNKREPCRILGKDAVVIKASEIFAVVKD